MGRVKLLNVSVAKNITKNPAKAGVNSYVRKWISSEVIQTSIVSGIISIVVVDKAIIAESQNITNTNNNKIKVAEEIRGQDIRR